MPNQAQGQVQIQSSKGNLTFQLPMVYSQHYYGIKQKYISFGAKDNRDNIRLARDSANRMQDDLEAGTFNPDNVTCYKHPDKQIKGRFQVKTEASFNVLELYQDFEKNLNVAITTLNASYRNYRNHIKEMEETCGYTLKQQLEIKGWIQSNVASTPALRMLALFDRMIDWGKREERLPDNFVSKFRSYAKEFKKSLRTVDTKRKPPKSVEHLIAPEGIKAWSEEERDIIIAAFYERKRSKNELGNTDCITLLIDFLFNVGCRHGEAFALTWSDISKDFTSVNIDESYSGDCHIVKCTKTGKNRLTPLNLRMQEMLRDFKPVDVLPSDLIFKNKKGEHLNSGVIESYWNPRRNKSVIGNLIKEGKLSKYFDAYSTRRTFVSIQINKGIPVTTVAKWVGDNPETILKHYARPDDEAVPY